ncbi:MAG: MerR family transcriptional regulator [Oscillospiraceae bacterium]|nr:MerR family transcriptional regulator [Oscillospiraceae bacterium]
MLYTVGEMAKLMGVPASTLRYYDKEGLLPFVERSEGGIRVFKESDYEWLKVIECLKKTGMQLKDIRSFILMAMEGDSTIDERLELIIKQREAVEKQITDLQGTLATLDFKKWYYETAKAHGTTDVPRNMTVEELPEEFREVRKKLRGE